MIRLLHPTIPITLSRRLGHATLALAVVCGVSGVGCTKRMTRRDEYYLIRGLTFQPMPGDGSTIVVGREQEILRALAGTEQVPIRGVNLDRQRR